jgi:hypothetical protein
MSNDTQRRINFDKIGRNLRFQILSNQNKNIQNYLSDMLKTESLFEESRNSQPKHSILDYNSDNSNSNSSSNILHPLTKPSQNTRKTVSFNMAELKGTQPPMTSKKLATQLFSRKAISNLNVSKTTHFKKSHLEKPKTLGEKQQNPFGKALQQESSHSSKYLPSLERFKFNKERENSIPEEIKKEDASSSATNSPVQQMKRSKTSLPAKRLMSSGIVIKKISKSKTIALNPRYLNSEVKGSDTNIAFDWRHTNIMNKEHRVKLKQMALELRKSLQVGLNSSGDDSDEKTIKTSTGNKSDILSTRELNKEQNRKLTRAQLVYDSCSEDEVEDNDIYLYVIDPDSMFVKIKELIVLLGLLYSTLVTPIELAFNIFGPLRYIILEVVVDVIYLFDFITNFYVSFYNFEEKLISNRKKIFFNYLQGWMVLDFISSIPVNSFYAILFNYRNDISIEFEMAQILIILRLFKYFKLFLKSGNHFDLSKLFRISANWTFLFAFLLYITINHILACLYIFLSKLEYGGWIDSFGFMDSDPIDIYIASFYFNSATIFTIGYGDIVSKHIYELAYNVLLLMIGIFIYSYAVSILSNYVQTIDEKTKKYEKNLLILQGFKIKYDIKDDVYFKIARFLKYEFMIYKIDNNRLLSELPVRFRNELMYNMYKDVIQNFVFFKSFENLDFINRVLLTLKPIKAIRNEIIMREGELVDETVFVKMGVLSLEVTINLSELEHDNPSSPQKDSILKKITKEESKVGAKGVFRREQSVKIIPSYKLPDVKTFKIIKLRRNEHFGDVLMFLNKPSPLSVRVTSKIAELLLLNKINLANIAKDYPDIFNKIYMKSVYNMDKIQLLIKSAKEIFINHQKRERVKQQNGMNRLSTQGLNEHSLPTIEELDNSYMPTIMGNLKSEANSEYFSEYSRVNTVKGIKSAYNSDRLHNAEYVYDISNKDFNGSIDSSNFNNENENEDDIERERSSTEEIKSIPNGIDRVRVDRNINGAANGRKNSFRYISEPTEQSINDECKGNISTPYFQHDMLNIENNFKKKNVNFTQIHNIINNGSINIYANGIKFNNKHSNNLTLANNFIPSIENAISFSIENTHERTFTMPIKPILKRSAVIEKSKLKKAKRNLKRKVRNDTSSSHSMVSLNSSDSNIKRSKRRRNTTKADKRDDNMLFGMKPSLDTIFTNNNIDNDKKSHSSFNSDDGKEDVTRRRHKMFSQVQRNIVSSNMNLENPDSFYMKWLLDMKYQKEANQKTHNNQKQNEKVVDRLGKLELLLKDKIK